MLNWPKVIPPDLSWGAIESQITQRELPMSTTGCLLVIRLKREMSNVMVEVPALKGRRPQCFSDLLKVKSSPEFFSYRNVTWKKRILWVMCLPVCSELGGSVGGHQFFKHYWPNEWLVKEISHTTIDTDNCRARLAFLEMKQLIFEGKRMETSKSLMLLAYILGYCTSEYGELVEGKLMMFWLVHL